MRTSPRRRKYSANCGLVMQNPVCWKQLACAMVGVSGGASAATMATRTNAVSSATRFIALLTPLCATFASLLSGGTAVALQGSCLTSVPKLFVTRGVETPYPSDGEARRRDWRLADGWNARGK